MPTTSRQSTAVYLVDVVYRLPPSTTVYLVDGRQATPLAMKPSRDARPTNDRWRVPDDPADPWLCLDERVPDDRREPPTVNEAETEEDKPPFGASDGSLVG